MLTFMNSKLPDDWQISDKQYHIFQKRKSYEMSNTDIYISEDLEFIIHVFYFTGLNVKKNHLTRIKLYLVIMSALELKVNKQKTHLLFSTKNFLK